MCNLFQHGITSQNIFKTYSWHMANFVPASIVVVVTINATNSGGRKPTHSGNSRLSMMDEIRSPAGHSPSVSLQQWSPAGPPRLLLWLRIWSVAGLLILCEGTILVENLKTFFESFEGKAPIHLAGCIHRWHWDVRYRPQEPEQCKMPHGGRT